MWLNCGNHPEGSGQLGRYISLRDVLKRRCRCLVADNIPPKLKCQPEKRGFEALYTGESR